MKILITGGAGYIGGVVSRLLLSHGHEVVVLDDLSTGHREVVPASVEFHRLSVHDVAQVLTEDAAFDAVLHFGAKLAVGESVVRPDLYWHTNVLGSNALLTAMREAGVRQLIFSSTGSMYRTADSTPLTEESPVQPENPYAASKYMVDMMIKAECSAFGLGAVSLRYFNAAGASGDLGERHDPETHLIPIALDVAAGRREKLTLFGDDYPTHDGTCVRDYIHVEDLASAHELALNAIRPSEHVVYNLGNGKGYSNREVITVVEEVTGRVLPIETAARREGDPASVVASSSKAERELGWRPVKPRLHDIVSDAWAYHQQISH